MKLLLTILPLLWGLSQPASAESRQSVHRDAPDCQRHLVGDIREDLIQALVPVLGWDPNAKLDHRATVLLQLMEEQILSLPQDRRHVYLSVLRNANYTFFKSDHLGLATEDMNGHVILLRRMTKDSLLAPIIVLHEMTHIAQRLRKMTVVQTAIDWTPLINELDHEYEAYAWEYRYIRSAFTEEDLNQLKVASSAYSPGELTRKIQEMGLFQQYQEVDFEEIVVEFMRRASSDQVHLGSNYLLELAHLKLIERLDKVQQMTEPQYARHMATRVDKYMGQWLRSLIFNGGLGLSTWWILSNLL